MVRQSSLYLNIADCKVRLIQNYEKNIGIFDMINMEKDRVPEANMIKKVMVAFTFIDN